MVVCGDVLDRSRGNGANKGGENDRQTTFPDDLWVLKLLNRWATLAEGAETGCALIRLLGNHDIMYYKGYSSEQGNETLRNADKDGT